MAPSACSSAERTARVWCENNRAQHHTWKQKWAGQTTRHLGLAVPQHRYVSRKRTSTLHQAGVWDHFGPEWVESLVHRVRRERLSRPLWEAELPGGGDCCRTRRLLQLLQSLLGDVQVNKLVQRGQIKKEPFLFDWQNIFRCKKWVKHTFLPPTWLHTLLSACVKCFVQMVIQESDHSFW